MGTPISHILKELDIVSDNKNIILGGPMMGKYVSDINVPIIKGSSGVFFLREKVNKQNHCILYGYFISVCPMHLMPMKFEEIFRMGKYFKLEKYNLSNCIECAACEYIYPSNILLIRSIKEGEIKLKELVNAILIALYFRSIYALVYVVSFGAAMIVISGKLFWGGLVRNMLIQL